MLSISVHNIRIHAPHGLYPQEAVTGNDFEVDVDARLPLEIHDEWPFVDYSKIAGAVHMVLTGPTVLLLETLVKEIFEQLRAIIPAGAEVKIAVRKLHPPNGDQGRLFAGLL